MAGADLSYFPIGWGFKPDAVPGDLFPMISQFSNTELVITFTIEPYYLAMISELFLDNDTGYWMFDTQLTRYSIDFIHRRGPNRLLYPASSNNFLESIIRWEPS